MIGYGEDSLTLWALENKLKEIMGVDELSKEYKVFYRPSFGRRKGIGEFDFIIVSDNRIYLGESKWLLKNIVNDKYIRTLRHRKFIKEIKKPLVSGKKISRLHENLNVFRKIFSEKEREIVNVLVFFYHSSSNSELRDKILSERIACFKTREWKKKLLKRPAYP